MDGIDVLASLIATGAAFGLFVGYDVVVSGGGINWLFDGAIAVGFGAMTLYFRSTEPADVD